MAAEELCGRKLWRSGSPTTVFSSENEEAGHRNRLLCCYIHVCQSQCVRMCVCVIERLVGGSGKLWRGSEGTGLKCKNDRPLEFGGVSMSLSLEEEVH